MTADQDPTKPTESLYQIRKLAIIAMFSDDVLFERLVLKGGNALDIVLGISGRTSVDIDFSMQGDFENFEDVKRRAQAAISERFDSAGFEIFDFKFETRPTVRRPGLPVEWGGYELEFKVIKKSVVESVRPARDRKFLHAEDVGPGFQKRLTIQISHHEYTEGSIEKELDDHVVVVYTPAMIALEKFRAICQQMPEYGLTQPPRSRARDFYDIYRICEVEGIRLDTKECGEMLSHMFAAKRVPVALMLKIADGKDLHEGTWGEVVAAAREKITEGFDFYFDYVVNLAKKLQLPGDE